MEGGGDMILFRIKLQRNSFISEDSLQFLSWLNNIFHVKDLLRFTFYAKLNNYRKKSIKKNYKESFNLTRKENL